MRVSVYRESRAAGLMANVGLRSKQGRGYRGLYSGLYVPRWTSRLFRCAFDNQTNPAENLGKEIRTSDCGLRWFCPGVPVADQKRGLRLLQASPALRIYLRLFWHRLGCCLWNRLSRKTPPRPRNPRGNYRHRALERNAGLSSHQRLLQATTPDRTDARTGYGERMDWPLVESFANRL